MKTRSRLVSSSLVVCLVLGLAVTASVAKRAKIGGDVAITGYVIDSACAIRQDLKKPISKDCAINCAKAGSPLVILSDEGTIYWPISNTIPAKSENYRLMDFAGDRVTVTGTFYEKGGTCGLVIEKVELLPPGK